MVKHFLSIRSRWRYVNRHSERSGLPFQALIAFFGAPIKLSNWSAMWLKEKYNWKLWHECESKDEVEQRMDHSRSQSLSPSRSTVRWETLETRLRTRYSFECIYNLDLPGLGWISFNFKARPMFPLILILPWKKAWWKTKLFVNVEHKQLNIRAYPRNTAQEQLGPVARTLTLALAVIQSRIKLLQWPVGILI